MQETTKQPDTVCLINLGCAKNLVDGEAILGHLVSRGYQVTTRPEEAGLIIVNTCGFVQEAKQEAINTILKAADLKCRFNQKLVVTGCLAVRYPGELFEEIPEIDAVVNPTAIRELETIISDINSGRRVKAILPTKVYQGTVTSNRLLSTPAHRAYLKIAEGCNHKCSFCSIPLIRGPYQSRRIEEVVSEATLLVSQGVHELTLVAQDTTGYGLDLYGERSLPELLLQLARIERLAWIRFLYAHPDGLNGKLLKVMREEEKICRYIDVPLQHASIPILRRMSRPVAESPGELVTRLRKELPGVVLRSTFIVGFPGETKADFGKLLDFLQEYTFDWAGFFAYSQEEDTPSADFTGQVGDAVKEERLRKAFRTQRKVTANLNKAQVGRILSLLVEKTTKVKSRMYTNVYGRTYCQAPEVDGLTSVKTCEEVVSPGSIITVKITGVRGAYDLTGQITH